MILYHASNVIVRSPDVMHSRDDLDFGKGFYLTVLKDQAVKYSRRFTNRKQPAYVNIYELDENVFNIYKVKHFIAYDEEWLDFVSCCRTLKPVEKYDIIIGGIADDKVFNTLDLYFDGLISKLEALDRLKYEKPNHQLCILNQAVIEKGLKFVDSIKLDL